MIRASDRLILGFVTILALVAATRLDHRPAGWWVIAACLVTAGLVWLLAHNSQTLGPVGHALRELYPIILVVALYGALDLINGIGLISVHDRLVQGWEGSLFGGQPSQDWWRQHPSAFWSTLLHGAYLSYYFIVPFPILYCASRRDWRAVRRVVTWTVTAFIVCYLCFLFFPVAGPYYEFPRPSPGFLDNVMARWVYRILDSGSSYGAAFPSSHVGASIVATAAAWRGSRALGLILAPLTALLTISVVYCQMHYAVDALAGIVLAATIAAAYLWGEGRDRVGMARERVTGTQTSAHAKLEGLAE